MSGAPAAAARTGVVARVDLRGVVVLGDDGGLELHPFVVILAVLAGGSLGGFLGTGVALPLTAVLIGLGAVLWGTGSSAGSSGKT